jgi:hypothetical protein
MHGGDFRLAEPGSSFFAPGNMPGEGDQKKIIFMRPRGSSCPAMPVPVPLQGTLRRETPASRSGSFPAHPCVHPGTRYAGGILPGKPHSPVHGDREIVHRLVQLMPAQPVYFTQPMA